MIGVHGKGGLQPEREAGQRAASGQGRRAWNVRKLAQRVRVCIHCAGARMCQVGKATGHRAAGRGESVKWLVPKFWQRKAKKEEEKEEEGDRGVVWCRSPEAHILSTK